MIFNNILFFGDFMDFNKDKYIIVEVIPTNRDKDKGFIAQISALKLEGLKLLDRFDYRVKDELIDNDDLKRIINYDKHMFTYSDNIYFIPEKFKQFVEDLPLIVFENDYTLNYLDYLDNKKELIYPYLNMEYNINVFDDLMKKYGLEKSNHLVDLIYESIIFESNDKK